MPLLEDEKPLPRKTLLTIGLPSFLIALLLSLVLHEMAHVAVSRSACAGTAAESFPSMILEGSHAPCPLASLAGMATTFGLALLSFALYMRFPGSLFLGSMAFINATIRLPETIWVFIQLLIHQKTDLNVDESVALRLLNMHDPAVGIVLLCFFSLTIFFLSVITVHDTRMVPSKWLIAVAMFALMFPIESFAWRFVVRMVG